MEYYVPLSVILGTDSIEKFLERIPLIGNALSGALEEASRQIGVRIWRETWNDHDVTVRGTAVWGHGDLTWDLGAFSLGIGRSEGETAEFDFELSSDRSSLLTAAAELTDELAGVGDLQTADGKAKVLFRADAPIGSFRLVLRGLNVRVRFSRSHLRKGRVVTGADGQPYRIMPLEAGSDDTAEIALAPGVLIVDSLLGVSFQIDDDEIVDVPPLLVLGDGGSPYLGVLVHKLKFDLSTERSIPEALAAGFDEAWRGVYFEELSFFNMDQLFLAVPNRADPRTSTDRRSVEAKNWFIGTEGLSGYLRIAFLPDEPWTGGNGPGNPGNRLFQGLSFELEFDRGRMVKAGGEVTLHVGELSSDLASLGTNGNLVIGFAARDTPTDALFLEAVVRVAEPRDPRTQSLVAIKDDLAKTAVMAVALLLGLPITDPLNSMARTLAVMFLELVIAVDWIDIRYIGLDALRIRRRPESLISGELIWWDFSVDLKLMFGLDTPDYPLLPKIKTDPNHPITMLIHGMRYSWASNLGDFDAAEIGDRKSQLGFDSDDGTGTPTNAVSFEIGDDSIVQGSPLVIVKLGAGQWDGGIWLDFGVKLAGKSDDISYSVMPSLIRIYFTNAGAIDHVDVKGASFSLLVPHALFAKGEWSGGDVSKATGRALLLCKGTSLQDYKDPSKWLYNVGFGMREQALPPAPAPKEVTSRIVAFDFESSSGIPTVILPGTSLYGISGLYASNARPALGSDTPSVWLTQHPHAYQVDIDKWEAAQDASGWAAGVVLGAAADHARPWNLKAGFVYTSPGPVLMLFGTANFLKQRLSVKDTNPAALTFYATLDLVRSEFLLGVRYDKRIPDATGRELKLSIPAELFISGAGWHLYLGQDKPAERMISAELLSRFKISGYLMFDSASITNLAETGVDVPGFVIAIGARFGFEAGWKGSHYKLYLYSKAAFDGAVSLADPHLSMVHLLIAGGLVAKAWGIGFEFEISAEFEKVWSTPDVQVGQLHVSLDLPWPIPNLSLTIDCSSGQDGDGEPIVGSLVDGLTLYQRSSQTCVEFTAGDVTDVPLDPVFSLAFKFPTRNGAGVPGTFNVGGGSASTYYFAAGDSAAPRGYAVTLEALTLYKDVGGSRVLVAGPIPALWRPDPQNAAGGQPNTRILELFAYQGIEASRFIGASADYVDWTTQGFDPCPPAHPPEPVCYGFDAVPVGPLVSELQVAQGAARPLVVSILGAARFAESVRRYYGLTRVAAEVVVSPVPGLAEHMLRLPASSGATPPVQANEGVRFEFERAEQATLLVLRYPAGIVRMRGFLAQTQVAEDDVGKVLGVLGEDRFDLVQYTLKGPLDRIEVDAAHGPGLRLRQSLVVRVCLTDSEAQQAYDDQLLAAANWSQFWSDLLDQDASASSALLLEPGTHYALEIRSSWAYLHEDLSLGTAQSGVDTFSFTTVPIDRPPNALRGPASALDESDWEVRTTPLDQEPAHYRTRPIRLEFRDARTDKVFGAFGKRLVLRLVDEHGQDLFDQLAFLRENATDLPEYQRAWRDRMIGLPCAQSGLDALWSNGVAHFSSLLQPGLHYDGALVMLPDSVTDLASIEDWTPYPALYHFAFKTSRYETLTAHVAAYREFDEQCEGAPDLAALLTALGSPGAGTRVDGIEALEDALFTHLGLLPRDPPSTPEIVRIWRPGPSAALEVVGILLDGPEPLLRSAVQLRVKRGSADVPVVTVTEPSGARILLLFPAAGSLGAQAAGALSLNIDGSYLDAGGVQNEVVQRALVIPSAPAALAPEPAP